MVLPLNRDPNLVTPFGLWLVKNLDQAAYHIWPFVKRSSFVKLTARFWEQLSQNRRLEHEIHELEEWHFSQSEYIPLPKFDVHFSEQSVRNSSVKRFRLDCVPLQAIIEVDTFNMRDPKYLIPEVKERLIRLTRKAWADMAEKEMRRYFREVYDR